jgi:hypothetical protein
MVVSLYDNLNEYLNRSLTTEPMDSSATYGSTINNAEAGGLAGNLKVGAGGQILTAGDDWNYISSAKVDYYSAHTLLVTNLDATTVLQKGDKVKIEQASATKYFTVQSVTADYVVLNATPTYSLTPDDINLFGYSRVVNPTGWTDEEVAWKYLTPTAFTFSSATRINISSSLLSYTTFNVGDKLVLQQGGATKYFYVYNTGSSYIDITAGTTYTYTSETITYIGYSRLSPAPGHPIKFSYTPTLGATSGSITGQGTVTATFSLVGDTCIVDIYRANATTGSGTTSLFESMPINKTGSTGYTIGFLFYIGTPTYASRCYIPSAALNRIVIESLSGASVGAATVTHSLHIEYRIAHN